jgi:hypothetical protein
MWHVIACGPSVVVGNHERVRISDGIPIEGRPDPILLERPQGSVVYLSATR